MTTQAQTTMTEQDINSINAFCDELEAYLSTGILPVLVSTWKGIQAFHVHMPRVVAIPYSGSLERKITCKVVSVPQGFEHMIGQHHSFSLLL